MKKVLAGVVLILASSAGLSPIHEAMAAPAAPKAPLVVLAGDDRIATAIAISQDSFEPDTATSVLIARSDGYADALAAVPLSAQLNAPLLLTPTNYLDPRTASEVARVTGQGSTVFVLGGVSAVSDDVAAQLRSYGSVDRLAGIDRFETANAVAHAVGEPQAIFLTDGTKFPDALTAGPAATALHGVVLLTDGRQLPRSTAAYLDDHPSTTTYAVGGAATQADPQAIQVAGSDRYETASLVAFQFFASSTTVGVAVGDTFADALAGSAHAAMHGGPLVLTTTSVIPEATLRYVLSRRSSVHQLYGYGGAARLSTEQLAVAADVSFTSIRGVEEEPSSGDGVQSAAVDSTQITVNNTVIWGQPGYHEDSSPAPVTAQVDQYRSADGIAAFHSGAVLDAYCYSYRGAKITDGNDSISSDDQWQYTSTLVYGVVLGDGRHGYMHSVWSTKRDDTLGLADCDAAGNEPPSPPDTSPDSEDLTVTLTESPFVCDDGVRVFGHVTNASPGELITFSSPGLTLLSGYANSAGTLAIKWQCTRTEAGTTWVVSLVGVSSGRSASFSVAGAAPQAPPAAPPPSGPVGGGSSGSSLADEANPCPNDQGRQYIDNIWVGGFRRHPDGAVSSGYEIHVTMTKEGQKYGYEHDTDMANLIAACYQTINGRMISSLSPWFANLRCEAWIHNAFGYFGINSAHANPIDMDVRAWVNGNGGIWNGNVAVCNLVKAGLIPLTTVALS